MSDLIDRQAAIQALDNAAELWNIAEPYHEGIRAGYKNSARLIMSLPSAQPEIIRCKDCKHWTQSMGKMKGYGLGRCDFHDADLVTCNGYCYWAERRTDG